MPTRMCISEGRAKKYIPLYTNDDRRDQSQNPKSRHFRFCLPENPGVRAAIFLARASLSISTSSFRGLRCTLNMDALPLMSGWPEETYIRYLNHFNMAEVKQ